ncbi:MAG: hypothetical protein OXC46_08785 [Thaumarchaeota archaeon]|nr:hypothetical protein [Nitrososphaerota archaeon]
MMWKLELDEDYFRIYDSKKMVAGYFDPDYGDIRSREDAEEIIPRMLKNHAGIRGGYVMVPLVKFNLFDTDLNIGINELDAQVSRVLAHVSKWKDFLTRSGRDIHHIRISHTDQDMLTITFPVIFLEPVVLEKSALAVEIAPIFDSLQKLDLL